MGRPKALLAFREGTFLSVLAGTLSELCSPVIAVFGFAAETALEHVPSGVTPVVNPCYQLGMLTSLQAGLRALGAPLPRVLFTPVDHPAVSAPTLAALFETDAPIVIPRYAGRRGHPVLLSPGVAAEILAEPSSFQANKVIDRNAAGIRYIDVDDPGVRDDVDTPELYEALLAREAGKS